MLANQGIIKMAGVENNLEKFLNARRIIIVACGTSWHAGLVGEYLIEEMARIPVEVEYASEFRYRNPIITPDDVVIAISQSGETADTLAAIKLAKSKGAFVFGVCNVVGSSIARETHAGAYTHAGPEIGVASTKAFTTQITVLSLIALKLAKEKGTLSKSEFHAYLQKMQLIPNKVQKLLEIACRSCWSLLVLNFFTGHCNLKKIMLWFPRLTFRLIPLDHELMNCSFKLIQSAFRNSSTQIHIHPEL